MKRSRHPWAFVLVLLVVAAITLLSTGCADNDTASDNEHPSNSERPTETDSEHPAKTDGEHPAKTDGEDPAKE